MSMTNRIQRLEEALGAGERLVVLSQPRDMSDEQLEEYLSAQGLSILTNDLVVSLRRFGEGHPDPWVKIDGVQA